MFNRMVEYSQDGLNRVFSAVADPTRRAILASLRNKSATISEIARSFPVSLNAVSKHVMVLERAGLIRRSVHGRDVGFELPDPWRSQSIRGELLWVWVPMVILVVVVTVIRRFWRPQAKMPGSS